MCGEAINLGAFDSKKHKVNFESFINIDGNWFHLFEDQQNKY